jgi:peptidoglycan hydrolase-like protein with peptidoglycan-binding domain
MPSRVAGRLRRDSSDSLQDTAPIEAEEAGGLEAELERQPPSRRRARIAALLAVLAAAVAIALVVILQSHSPKGEKRGGGIPVGDTTTVVQRRTLTEHASIEGTLTYGSELELYDRLSGTFTWLPVSGVVIRRGGTLFEVNQLPIVLMYGSVPAYRTLKEGVSNGADVKELNENLIALGYDPYGEITEYEDFGAATAAAVKRWQAAEGFPESGEVELGRVVFAPGARRVTEIHVGLGQDPPGGSSSETPQAEEPAGETETTPGEGSASQGNGEEPAGRAKAPAGKEPAGKAPAGKEPAGKAPAGKEPAGKEPAGEAPGAKEHQAKEPAANEPGGRADESGEGASAGEASDNADGPKSPSGSTGETPGSTGEPSGGAGGMLVLTTTSTQQLVQLSVEAAQQQLAHVGEKVPVTLPNGSTVRGRITKVGTVATESSGGDGEGGEGGAATISVTVALEHPVKRLDEAPVTVELVEESVKGVLTVPATALIATAGGRYAIEALEHGRATQLEVTPGMFSDGYVEIEGPGVHEGLTVTEPFE